jgi:hypothetical protein
MRAGRRGDGAYRELERWSMIVFDRYRWTS